MGFRFETAVLGGTFDHFHRGHEKLLEHALSISEKLVIGITTDEYIKKLKTNNEKLITFENFKVRKRAIENLLNRFEKNRFEIVEINDLFGPTLDQNFNADAIVVSKDSKNGALKINEERAKIGLNQLYIEVFPEILAEDGILISSMRIRNGEVDRDGKLYVNPKWHIYDLEITDEIRRELKIPFGKLSEKIDSENLKGFEGLVISVGDETSKVLNSLSIPIQISVIDFKIAREKRFTNVKELGFSGNVEIIKVVSPAGIISKELFNTIDGLFKNPSEKTQIILIDGEDDLSVLPLILASPLGNHIFYGQPARHASEGVAGRPQEGIVEIQVNEENKAKIRQIVSRFTPHHS